VAERVAESCGGMSFAAATKVLLTDGKTSPISQLQPGDEVLATNTELARLRPRQ
jgi:hypothetical protein